MQRPLTRLFTLLVFAFATLCMASATSAQSKPHLATGFGQFAANQADFTGFGQATHLGKYTEVGNVQLAPSGNALAAAKAIRAKMTYVAGADMEQEISDEVISEERIAFAFWVTRADGRQLIEHTILHLADGKIARQVDVEAWD